MSADLTTTKTVRYFAVRRHEKVITTTQRCASVSMIETLAPMQNEDVREITSDEVLQLRSRSWEVLMWLRHPYHRIACAYHIYGKRFTSVNDFVSGILRTENPHWSPQTRLHTHKGVFLPTKVLTFDNLALTWPRELPDYSLQHLGRQSTRLQWFNLAGKISLTNLSEINKHWQLDIEMFRRVAAAEQIALRE